MEQMQRARGLVERTMNQEAAYEDFYPSSDWTHDPERHVLLVDLPGFKKEELKVRVDNFGKVTVAGERKVSAKKYQRFKQVYDIPEDSDVNSVSGRFDGGLLFITIPKKKVEKIEHKVENQATKNEIEEEMKDKKQSDEENQKKTNISEQGHGLHGNGRNAEQGLEKNGTHKMGKENKSEQTDRKKEFDGDGMYNPEANWQKLKEKVKNKEEIEVLVRGAMDNIRKNQTVIITAVLAFSIGAYISYKFHTSGK